MPPTRFSEAYQAHKNSFISRNSENSLLITAIKILERQIKEMTIPPGWAKGAIFISTGLEPKKFSELGCIYAVNIKTGEAAPCILYFPEVDIETPAREKGWSAQIDKVLTELGWD